MYMKLLLLFNVLFYSIIVNGQSDCKTVTDVDKFTGKVSIKTPVECSFGLCPLILGKVINKVDTTYYLHVSTRVEYGTHRAQGFT